MAITAGDPLIHEIIQAPTLYSRLRGSKRPLVTFSVISGADQSVNDNLPKMSALEYYDLVKNLIMNGRLEHKHAEVLAFDIPRLEGETLQDTGSREMSEAILRPDRVVVMDMDYFPDPDEAGEVMEKIFKLYGQAITDKGVCDALNSGQLVKCVVSAIGMWTVEAIRFHARQTRGAGYKGDYVPTGRTHVYKSLPGTGRVVTGHIGEDRNMIVGYDNGFNIRKSAGIATFFDKIGEIIEDVAKVDADAAKHGGVVREEAVIEHICKYVPQVNPKTGEPIIDPETKAQKIELQGKHDIYGMFLGFRKNYTPYMVGDELNADGQRAVELLTAQGNALPLLPRPRKRGLISLVRSV